MLNIGEIGVGHIYTYVNNISFKGERSYESLAFVIFVSFQRDLEGEGKPENKNKVQSEFLHSKLLDP